VGALDDVIQYHADNCQSGSECDLSALSRAELAALRNSERYWQEQAETQRADAAAQRERAAELEAAHVYLDESYVNDPSAEPLPLADRIAVLVNRITEQEQEIDRLTEQVRLMQGRYALRK